MYLAATTQFFSPEPVRVVEMKYTSTCTFLLVLGPFFTFVFGKTSVVYMLVKSNFSFKK